MGRTNPYVSKEQEFALFRFSFDAGTCSSLHQNFSGPCTKHLSRVSPFQLDPTNATNVMFPFLFNFLLFQDLRPIFHWNTKQLFLYLSAEYNNTQGVCSPSHVSISVRPASNCPTLLRTPNSSRTPKDSFCVLFSDHQRGCDMGPYCSPQGKRNHSYR
jgi:hypothetical protein